VFFQYGMTSLATWCRTYL